MTNQEAFLIGRALGFAESGYWNDTLDALIVCPRPLFERVEGFIPANGTQAGLDMTIRSWAAENGLTVPMHAEDISGKYGPSPWTADQH